MPPYPIVTIDNINQLAAFYNSLPDQHILDQHASLMWPVYTVNPLTPEREVPYIIAQAVAIAVVDAYGSGKRYRGPGTIDYGMIVFPDRSAVLYHPGQRAVYRQEEPHWSGWRIEEYVYTFSAGDVLYNRATDNTIICNGHGANTRRPPLRAVRRYWDLYQDTQEETPPELPTYKAYWLTQQYKREGWPAR